MIFIIISSCLITDYEDNPNNLSSPLYVEPLEGLENFYTWDDWKNHYGLTNDDVIDQIFYVKTGKERSEEISLL